MNRLMAGWETAFDSPVRASSANSTTSDCARAATATRQAAVTSRQPRIAVSAPTRSAKRPPGPAPSAPAAKNTLTPEATAATLTSRSPRICSASAPTRNPGRTVVAPAAMASADGPASRGARPFVGLRGYARPTRFAIVITPITHRTMPMMSNTAPALIIRVIGKSPDE